MKSLQDGAFLRRIDRGGRPAFWIVQQNAKIITAAKKDVYFQRFHRGPLHLPALAGAFVRLNFNVGADALKSNRLMLHSRP
jgi:hypothetical protein